jgi:hypothetical protein
MASPINQTTADLLPGEFGINSTDGKVYIEKSAGITTIVAVNPWSVGIGSTSFDMHHLDGRVAIGTDSFVSLMTIGDVTNVVSARGSLSLKTIPSSGTVGEAALYLEEKSGSEGWYLAVDVDGDLNFNNSSSAINSVEFLDDDSVVIRKGHLGIMTSAAQDALTVLGNARITGVATIGGNFSLDAGLFDINNTLGTDGQVLTSTGAGVSWKSGGAGATVLDDLTDVTISAPATNQVLQYNGSAWVNATSSGGTTLGLVVAASYNMLLP